MLNDYSGSRTRVIHWVPSLGIHRPNPVFIRVTLKKVVQGDHGITFLRVMRIQTVFGLWIPSVSHWFVIHGLNKAQRFENCLIGTEGVKSILNVPLFSFSNIGLQEKDSILFESSGN